MVLVVCFFFFFFQAEDGIRDDLVTGVQTCALPISRPEANNVLLSILQDKLLALGNDASSGSYVEVHPGFTAIFTSNPEEYAGTFKSQDALRDRMITIDLEYPDYETEMQIIYEKGRIPLDVCKIITDIVRILRDSGECEFSPTIRSGIKIAKTLTVLNMEPEDNYELFSRLCQDILSSETGKLTDKSGHASTRKLVQQIIADQQPIQRSFLAI